MKRGVNTGISTHYLLYTKTQGIKIDVDLVENTMSLNRLHNCKNPYQGKKKKVLCVCSAGLLRSPTAAKVLSKLPYDYNTRAVGVSKEYALIQVDDVLIAWADEIVCMNTDHWLALNEAYDLHQKTVFNLEIPDNFSYDDEELKQLIMERYDNVR